ncbi:hypothetical protein ACT691_16580 [Vibrio metschnikovii]
MQWLAADTRQGEENSQRQWKETLIRMSLNPCAEAEKLTRRMGGVSAQLATTG